MKKGDSDKGLVSPLRSPGVNEGQGKAETKEPESAPNPLGYNTGNGGKK